MINLFQENAPRYSASKAASCFEASDKSPPLSRSAGLLRQRILLTDLVKMTTSMMRTGSGRWLALPSHRHSMIFRDCVFYNQISCVKLISCEENGGSEKLAASRGGRWSIDFTANFENMRIDDILKMRLKL